ncbi:Cro/CI family transcriptional regulator [Lactobacillus amylovorus GRL1118]|uniref:transcriptional regulator n=1 Tax=Lactobacillus amylovorus TaxID=1604 RepID=UPI00020165DB|nr:helix-turn-helix transcriptional regulator [Lactobacillus amylovorus]AEA31714.1 Cro/CI family transcriptional regulator [Lactobacillus amylovorus GRL1118]
MIKNRLKEMRKKHNFTLDDIQKMTGIKRGTYSNYENGNTEPKIETWQKLANFFGVSVPYLQGITFTKTDILKLLNDTYFNELNNDFDSVVTPVRTYSQLKKIPLPEKVLTKMEQDKFNKNTYDFWSKNYSFIFLNPLVKNLSGVPNEKNFVENAKYLITKAIREEVLELSSTPISEKFNDLCSNDLHNFNSEKDAFLRLGSKTEIENKVLNLIASLTAFDLKLKNLPENKNENNLNWEDFY